MYPYLQFWSVNRIIAIQKSHSLFHANKQAFKKSRLSAPYVEAGLAPAAYKIFMNIGRTALYTSQI